MPRRRSSSQIRENHCAAGNAVGQNPGTGHRDDPAPPSLKPKIAPCPESAVGWKIGDSFYCRNGQTRSFERVSSRLTECADCGASADVQQKIARIWLPLHGIRAFHRFESVTCLLIGIELGRRSPNGILLFRKQAACKFDDVYTCSKPKQSIRSVQALCLQPLPNSRCRALESGSFFGHYG